MCSWDFINEHSDFKFIFFIQWFEFVTEHISEEGNKIGCVCLSVFHSNFWTALPLSWIFCLYMSVTIAHRGLKIKS